MTTPLTPTPDGRQPVDPAVRPGTLPADAARDQGVAHPVGTAVGAAGGAAAGAVGGMAAGPVGSLFGAAAGAVLGGLATSGGSTGARAGQRVDPVALASEPLAPHWEQDFPTRPYADGGGRFEDYALAYRYGAWARRHAPGNPDWSFTEPELAIQWPQLRGASPLTWAQARLAAFDAWVEQNRSVSP